MGLLTGYFSLIGYEDGIGYEEIYRLTSSSTTPSTPSSSNTNGAVPSGWYSTPQSVSRSYPYQWVSKRSKVDGNWGVWSTPVEYNRFVEDAKTYEYCYKATQYNSTPSTPTSSNVDGSVPSGWYSTQPSISAINAYVWVSQRVKTNGSWSAWSTPTLKNRWAYDGKDGANGGKGAKMRMRTWASGVRYLQGAEGEEFYDIVLYGTQLYLCIKSHTASTSNAPNVSTTYWESAQQWTFIATQLLLAGKIVSDKITADLIDADGINATDVNISGTINANNGTFKDGKFTNCTAENFIAAGIIKAPWVNSSYKLVVSAVSGDVYGYSAAPLYCDKIKIVASFSGEVVIPWGNDANGRELLILVSSSPLEGISLTIKIPTGKKILYGTTTYTNSFTLNQKTLYSFIGMNDGWIVRILALSLNI